MMYKAMKKIIESKNAEYKAKGLSKEEYQLWQTVTMRKLDVFLAYNRITADQYEELVGLFIKENTNISA